MKMTLGRHSLVYGLSMYYEIHGNGFPLVLIHGGGSTITTTFGTILPELAKNNQCVAVELQAHGHTSDRDRPLTFEQDADDLAALLHNLDIQQASFVGFSNGGTTCIQVALRHPKLVNKLVLIAAAYKRSGFVPGLWESLNMATLDNMPKPLKDAYAAINPDPQGLKTMFNRDRDRMLAFADIDDNHIREINCPAFVISGDRDVITIEHSIEISGTVSNGRLAILPGEHGAYIGEICSKNTQSKIPLLTAMMINEFLELP